MNGRHLDSSLDYEFNLNRDGQIFPSHSPCLLCGHVHLIVLRVEGLQGAESRVDGPTPFPVRGCCLQHVSAAALLLFLL